MIILVGIWSLGCLFSGHLSEQARPDFSGTWICSQMGLAGKTDPEVAARVLSERTLVIKQTASELQIRRERKSDLAFMKSPRGLDVGQKRLLELQKLTGELSRIK